MIVGKQSSEMMTERFNRWLWNDVVNKCTQDFSGSLGKTQLSMVDDSMAVWLQVKVRQCGLAAA